MNVPQNLIFHHYSTDSGACQANGARQNDHRSGGFWEKFVGNRKLFEFDDYFTILC
jgi:homoserine acetyltransferase